MVPSQLMSKTEAVPFSKQTHDIVSATAQARVIYVDRLALFRDGLVLSTGTLGHSIREEVYRE
jgi:hypothetical protein